MFILEKNAVKKTFLQKYSLAKLASAALFIKPDVCCYFFRIDRFDFFAPLAQLHYYKIILRWQIREAHAAQRYTQKSAFLCI